MNEHAAVVAIIALGVIVWTALVGLVVTACVTNRELAVPTGLTTAGVVAIAVLGGVVVRGLHRNGGTP